MNTPTPIARPNWRFLLAHPAHIVALGFGSGLSPRAPGTVGSLAAIPLYALLLHWVPAAVIALLCIPLFVLGLWACQRTGKALGVHDHGAIVWDEMVAMWLILSIAPVSWQGWGAAFALFRLFDIWKPWPISWLDRNLPGGLGVMADDLAAAAFAMAVLYWLTPWL